MTELKRTVADLQSMQSMSLKEKVRYFREVLRHFHHVYDDTYVSISGGKDSEVLLYLARLFDPDLPAVYAQTGLDYPSVKEMALSHRNVTVVKPVKSHWEILTEFGYPVISKDVSLYVYGARHGKNEETRQHYRNRFDGLDDNGNYSERRQGYKKYKFLLDAPFEISALCCYYLKELPCRMYEKETGRKPITGIMACESFRRQQAWLKTGCNSFSESSEVPMCKPLSVWLEKDILQFLYENEDVLMEALKEECMEKGMTEEEFYEKHKHPWAEAYGKIEPMIAKDQLDGQISLFDELNISYQGCNFKTSGCDRTGCMYCMFGAQCRGDERFVRLKESEPEIFDFVMNGGTFNENGMWVPGKNISGKTGLGFRYVIDWMNEKGNLNIRY